MKYLTLIAAVFLGAVAPGRGQLVFDNPKQVQNAKLKQTTMTADFGFTNKGDKTVTISRLNTSCGCTTTKLDKRSYKPGESGTISAKLTFSATPGNHTKYVYVRTDETRKGKLYKLSIGAIVPEIAKLRPAYLKWARGEEPAPKTVRFTVTYKDPVKVVEIKNSNENWKAELETVKDGDSYRVKVTPPADTTQVTRTILTLVTDLNPDDPYEFRVTARVARKRRKPKTNWLLELLR